MAISQNDVILGHRRFYSTISTRIPDLNSTTKWLSRTDAQRDVLFKEMPMVKPRCLLLLAKKRQEKLARQFELNAQLDLENAKVAAVDAVKQLNILLSIG